MKPEICTGRLNLVACIIAYRYNDNGSKEFFMIQREDEKFALIGGMGACCLSENMYEFAKREFDFDMNTDISIKELEYVDATLNSDGTTLTLFFCYHYKSYNETNLDGKWFFIEEIKVFSDMNNIAFDGYRHVSRFLRRSVILGQKLSKG